MNPAKTAQKGQSGQKSATGDTPFDQITELEQRENARIEKEISALAKEKAEVTATIAKKEDEASEKHRDEAKAELKEYSEKELDKILSAAKKEAASEADSLEKEYEKFEASAAKDLVQKAKDPDFLLAA